MGAAGAGGMAESAGEGLILFDRYRLEERVGAGGMGVVWRATDMLLEQPVALKRISLAGGDASEAELTRARTLREARTAAVLRHHPHVVATYDVRLEGEDIWLVLEYLPALSLAALRRERGGLGVLEVAGIGSQVADALAASHARGIVHRDVTPGNVLVAEDGTVKLADFGLARPLVASEQLTRRDVVSGTIAYLAPEVAAGGEATAASDVFSLGSTLYAAVEGQPPFGTDPNSLRLLNVVRTGIIRAPTAAGALTPLLLRLLELNPATRPDAATVRELCAQFIERASANTEPLPSPRQITVRPAAVGTSGRRTLSGWARRRSVMARMRRGPRRWRRIAGGLAGLALIATVIVGAGLMLIRPEQPHGIPPMPTQVGALALTGDPKAAEPCALMDLGWLDQFGYPRLTTPPTPHECRAQITTPVGIQARLDIGYYTPLPPNTALGGPVQDLGGLSIVRDHPVKAAPQPLCENMILLSDRTRILIDALSDRDTDLCQLADVGTASAVNALAEHGITYRPDRTARWPIARADACALLTPADFAATGINPSVRDPGYANWWCHWANDPATSVELTVRLDQARVADYGRPTTIAGRRGWVRQVELTPPVCDAVVVSHPATSLDDATELIEVSYQAPGSDQDRCARATQLAAAALVHLPAE